MVKFCAAGMLPALFDPKIDGISPATEVADAGAARTHGLGNGSLTTSIASHALDCGGMPSAVGAYSFSICQYSSSSGVGRPKIVVMMRTLP
jgi:hypothetical protein